MATIIQLMGLLMALSHNVTASQPAADCRVVVYLPHCVASFNVILLCFAIGNNSDVPGAHVGHVRYVKMRQVHG